MIYVRETNSDFIFILKQALTFIYALIDRKFCYILQSLLNLKIFWGGFGVRSYILKFKVWLRRMLCLSFIFYSEKPSCSIHSWSRIDSWDSTFSNHTWRCACSLWPNVRYVVFLKFVQFDFQIYIYKDSVESLAPSKIVNFANNLVIDEKRDEKSIIHGFSKTSSLIQSWI